MAKKKSKENAANMSAVFVVVMISVLLLLVGGTVSFLPEMKLIYFAYIGGAFLIVSGLLFLIKYFVKKEYKLVSNYDFSEGVAFIILGILALLRSMELTGSISSIMGLLMLIEAIIFLQYTVQLKIVKAGAWWVITLIVTLVITLAALETVLDFASLFSKNPNVFYIVLVAIGIIGLLWILIVTNRTHSFVKKEAELSERNLEDDITTARKEEPVAEIEAEVEVVPEAEPESCPEPETYDEQVTEVETE